MSLLENPAIASLIVGLPAFILGVLAYWRSRKIDEVTEQSGVATQQVAGVNQVIDGLNKLILGLQDDNKLLREKVIDLDFKLKQLQSQIEELKTTIKPI